jgi:hypothetical protein
MTFSEFLSTLTLGERRDLLDWLERCITQFREKGPESRCMVLVSLLAELERA